MPCPSYWVLFTLSLSLPEIRVTNSEGSEGRQGSPAIHKHSSYMKEELGILQFVTWHKNREKRQQFTLLISNDLKEAVIETFFLLLQTHLLLSVQRQILRITCVLLWLMCCTVITLWSLHCLSRSFLSWMACSIALSVSMRPLIANKSIWTRFLWVFRIIRMMNFEFGDEIKENVVWSCH